MKEMNEAFKEELADMEANERTARELEECYFSDEEDLVVNPAARNRKSSQVLFRCCFPISICHGSWAKVVPILQPSIIISGGRGRMGGL